MAMAQRPSSTSPEYLGTQILANAPPPVALDSPVLGSAIALPDDPRISFRQFTPAADTGPSVAAAAAAGPQLVERARRRLVAGRRPTMLGSLLPVVHVGRELAALFVFAVDSAQRSGDVFKELSAVSFDGLVGTEVSSFAPQDLYPCSPACSAERTPCPACLAAPSPPSAAPGGLLASLTTCVASAACLLPRQPLRGPYARFIEAVRLRLVDDIAGRSSDEPARLPVKRLRGGFLLGTLLDRREWSAGWERHADVRPLIHCQLQIHLARACILVHPVLRPTSFQPLPPSLTLPPGTPITLVPYATPAYFLTHYAGPSSALTAQFEPAFAGLGVGNWKTAPTPTSAHRRDPAYVIAWIRVQNTQGEEKGMTVIWPASLCLALHPASRAARARRPLVHIPDLPVQLQPSPPQAPVHAAPSPNASEVSDATFTARPRPCTPPLAAVPPRPFSSPSGEAAEAFRNLTLARSRPVRHVAEEVKGYVDTVAKERERDREKMRREREAGASPKTPKTPGGPAQGPARALSFSTTPMQETSMDIDSKARMESPSPLGPAFVEEDIKPRIESATAPTAVVPEVVAKLEEVVVAPLNAPSGVAAASSADRTPPTAYDPFGSFDGSWSQPANDFMNMGMDYDINFGMTMDTMSSTAGAAPIGMPRDMGGPGRMDMDFEDGFGAFTDDDFSFFDGPPVASIAPTGMAETAALPSVLSHPGHGPHLHTSSGLTPAAGPAPLGMSPPAFSHGIGHAGTGPPSAAALSHPSPWAPSHLMDGMSPRVVSHTSDANGTAPELMFPTPQDTPSSISQTAPATPAVHILDQANIVSPGALSSAGTSLFDPIPFASTHRIADGKYARGKFALPSPPDEEDRTEALTTVSPRPRAPRSISLPSTDGWKSNYLAVTDPRIGVVRKLIGVKRKSFEQGSRDPTLRRTTSWIQEHDEWEGSTPRVDDIEELRSEAESDDEPGHDDSLTPRSVTPPPAYLPLGPSLLCTQFQHAHLLPLSKTSRHPEASLAPSATTVPALPSVPTPVSPAALLGAALEKSKSLEAAAQILAKEVVENSLWADTWAPAASSSCTTSCDIWQADVRRALGCFRTVQELQCPLSLKALVLSDRGDIEAVEPPRALHPPLISVGKADAVIRVLPTALRFWEKLGLGPRGGKKDVEAFVFFEDDGGHRQEEVLSWLTGVSAAYSAKNYGEHVPGSAPICSVMGLVPIRFESFRKDLSTFLAALAPPQSHLVFYVVTPPSIASLESPILRHIFSSIKRALKTEAQVLFHLVPEHLVVACGEDRTSPLAHIHTLVDSVYDRLLSPVDRQTARRFFGLGERIQKRIQDPAYTLARPMYSKVRLLRETPVRSLDVVDRHTLLHVGYTLSSCGKWILAACVDQRGEAHDLGVWLAQSENGGCIHGFVVNQVWTFAMQFARRANIEWRVLFAKLGPMGATELEAWMGLLSIAGLNHRDVSVAHASVLSVEADSGWTFVSPSDKAERPPRPSSSRVSTKDSAGSFFVDASAADYMLPLSSHMPLAADSYLQMRDHHSDTCAFVPDSDENHTQEEPGLRPLLTHSLIHVPAGTDYTSAAIIQVHMLHAHHAASASAVLLNRETQQEAVTNFHELAVLARARWRLRANPALPFHLAALEVMQGVLDGVGSAD